MVNNLDPHSKYLDKERIKRNNEEIRGSFGGIGIFYQILDDTLMVLSVTPDGPSKKAGIRPGDRFLEINGETVCGIPLSHKFFSKRLRGKQGSMVEITILRHDNKKVEDIVIKRAAIPIHTLDVAYMLDEQTGYIRLNMFSRTTMKEFNSALVELMFQGMKQLVLDLRGNPGGLMIASIQLADEFLTKDKLIVYTQGEHYEREDYKSSNIGKIKKGRLIVLMDEYSASASEICAGAIQDWDRGLIMGRRSYGKGLVGRNFMLPDGSALRLTTGRYYTPSGRCIQKSYAKGRNDYQHDLDRRYLHGEFIHADSIKLPDSLLYRTHNGRKVYGGGGIMPDIFFPLDTSYYSGFLRKINSKGAINYFAARYFDLHLEELLHKYPDYERFHQGFTLSDDILNEFKDLCKQRYKIEADSNDWAVSKEYIRWNIKAALARSIYEDGSYFKERGPYDKMLQEAKAIINDPKVFKKHGVQAK
jgi:carboxyl-terminal processing protease